MEDGVYRNSCPRNCFGTCGILSHVENGRLVKVAGDPAHGFSQGHLCAKGYAFTQYVYSENRLKFPMKQSPRGSGKWIRISWEEAFTAIAEKMIELKSRYGSNLASGYNKYSGNLGLLHYAVEGMFNSIGPHTKPVGNPCALSGKHAINRSFGQDFSSDPEAMANAELIVLWGANPAVTNVHQMKFIQAARRKGALFAVIDPVFTPTAQKADLYIQIKPGTDAWLAYGISKILLAEGKIASDFLAFRTAGWEPYRKFLEEDICLEEVYKRTGVCEEAVRAIADLYGERKNAFTWNGLGIQRNTEGRGSIEAINSLAAMAGNLTAPYGGLYYMHFDVEDFPLSLLNHEGPGHSKIKASREVDIGHFARGALNLQEPPLKLLWIASRNIATQDQNLNAWKELLSQLELIVVVDLYMTKTAEQADIVLPAASHFEEEDLNVGYWHYWLSLNQKAIPPYYEAKSDLQIARELTARLNELAPGFSNFPSSKEPIDWIKEELTPEMLNRYSIASWEDLLDGPRKRQDLAQGIPSGGKFNFPGISEALEMAGKTFAPTSRKPGGYRLLSPQSLLRIHSQYEKISWLYGENPGNWIEISAKAAREQEIEDGAIIELFNEHGALSGIARINPTLPDDVVQAAQAGSSPVNQLIASSGGMEIQESTYFYDSLVMLRKWSGENV